MLRVGVIMYQTSLTKGQELVAQRMVEEFRRQGEEAFLITSVFQDWELVVGPEQIEERGGYVTLFDERLRIPVIRVRSTLASWPPRRISFVDFIATLTKIVDDLKLNVLVTHSTLWNGPEEAAKFVEWRRNLAKKGAPFRRVVLCHMSHFQEADEERYTVVERTYRETWNQVSLSQIVQEADILLVTTPLEKQAMERLGAPPEKCILFPGGIVLPRETLSSAGDLARLGIPSGKKLVTVLGTVEERKNDLAVLEVAGMMRPRRDVQFVIAGKLEGDYGEKVADGAAGLENVSLVGPVSDAEKGELIRRSYVDLTLSRSEALGLAQMEFIYSDVPVVTSGVGGQSWVVRDGTNGVVLGGPDDIEGAVEAISALLDDRGLREGMGRRAKDSVRPYSMAALIRNLIRKLIRIVEGSHGETIAVGPEEEVIDSMIGSREKVVVTNKRLILSPLDERREPIEIPYEEIVKITRRRRVAWRVVAIGAASMVLLLAAAVAMPALAGLLPRALARALVPKPGVPSTLAVVAIVMAPLLASIGALVLTRRDEFRIHRSNSSPVHVPGEFSRLLRIVDKLAPRDLMDYPDD